MFFVLYALVALYPGLASLFPLHAARSKTRGGEGRQRGPHPVGTPSPPSPPPTPATSYTIRIYDYTNVYSPYVHNAANYYASWMEPADGRIDVQYIRGAVLDYATCWGTDPNPLIGVRMCENLPGPGTAGSTGMDWHEVSPGNWALNSAIVFEAEDWDHLYGCDTCGGQLTAGGDYLTVHELGHSTGNLPHRGISSLPRSAMSDTGTYAPATLLPSEKAQILSLLPT